MSSSGGELGRDYDVVVIGGGPAGTTVATLLGGRGHRVLLLERETLPRFHVGESLVPATWGTLDRLGLIPWLRQSAYPKKYSVQFVTEDGRETTPFYFDEFQPGESSQTWQVWRDEFDAKLVANAAEHGAVVRTGMTVTEVLFEDERATGVRVQESDSETREISARIVVDATGMSAFLASRLKLKQSDRRLKKATVWGSFRGGMRGEGRDEGATVILQTEGKRSWFWYIPLPDDMVSVGCTGGLRTMFPPGGGADAEAVFERELARCPGMQRRLVGATREGPLRTTRDFSYRADRAAGDGWVIVGDALSFIDPVYSTGVFLALKSGELAADAIDEALAADDTGAERLGSWRSGYDRGVMLFHKLVYAFYTPGFSFGTFLRTHPECRDHLSNILMGNVFEPGLEELFDVMGEVIPPPDVADEVPAG